MGQVYDTTREMLDGEWVTKHTVKTHPSTVALNVPIGSRWRGDFVLTLFS